jgi:DNA-binding MurR/RpiR family transcriptional regulator
MNLYQQLIKNKDLTDTEQHVASYLVQHADEIHLLSIQKVARASNTSIATVSRLCQNLGFRGFKDFRVRFYQDYLINLCNERQVNPNAPFNEGDSEFNVATNLASLTKNSITECQAFVDHHAIQEAHDLMKKSTRIIGIGVSDSFIRLIDFQNKMLKIGYVVSLSYFQTEQVFLCTEATPKDCAIIASFSGETAEVINEAKILHERKVPTISITAGKNSPLALLTDIPLFLPNIEDSEHCTYTLASQVSLEYMLNVLFACMYANTYSKSRKRLEYSHKKYLNKKVIKRKNNKVE